MQQQMLGAESKSQHCKGTADRRCQVCNDEASGLHYGAWTCEGCKAFFRRSIHGTTQYVCPAEKTCEIDRTERKCCQACRLEKCHRIGMSIEKSRRHPRAQRKKSENKTTEKKPTAKNKTASKKKFMPLVPNMPDTIVSHNNCHRTNLIPSTSRNNHTANVHFEHSSPRDTLPLGHIGSYTCNNAAENVYHMNTEKMEQVLKVLVNEQVFIRELSAAGAISGMMAGVVAATQNIEVEHGSCSFASSSSFCSNSSQTSAMPAFQMTTEVLMMVLKTTEEVLTSYIRWARLIPGFNDLYIQDQIHLVLNSWTGATILSTAYLSMPYDNSIYILNKLVVTPNDLVNIFGDPSAKEVGEYIVDLTRRMAELDFTVEHLVCLKGILLTSNIETCKLRNVPQVEELEQLCLEMLLVACRGDMLLLNRLLLLLPHVFYTAFVGRQLLLNLQKNWTGRLPGTAQLPALLDEMINSFS